MRNPVEKDSSHVDARPAPTQPNERPAGTVPRDGDVELETLLNLLGEGADTPDGEPTPLVGALGRRRARAYRALLKTRAPLLREAMTEAVVGAARIERVRSARALGQTPTVAKRERRGQLEAFVRALEALLDLSDTLTARREDTVIEQAGDYLDHGITTRANALLREHTTRHADDADAWSLLGQGLEAARELDGAIDAHARAVALAPSDAALRRDLGVALLGRLDHDEGIAELRRASASLPEDEELRAEIERAETLRRCSHDADRDETMPTIAPCEAEREDGGFREETLALAEHLYRKHGTLQIDGVFDKVLLEACREQFLDEYRAYLGEERQDDALPIGHRRFQVSIALHGAFNDPGFYANPFVLELVRRLLGRKAIVGSTVCATSLPGARDQHLHKDHRALFTSHDDDDPIELPPVSITTMIPLVPLDRLVGSTLVRKGSHRFGVASSASMPEQVPLVPLGSCFLMDLALSHQGLGNRSERVRPIVNMVYHQPWFADNKNFKVQPPLQINAAEFARIPSRHRRLFEWCIQPGPQVER